MLNITLYHQLHIFEIYIRLVYLYIYILEWSYNLKITSINNNIWQTSKHKYYREVFSN